MEANRLSLLAKDSGELMATKVVTLNTGMKPAARIEGDRLSSATSASATRRC